MFRNYIFFKKKREYINILASTLETIYVGDALAALDIFQSSRKILVVVVVE